jgi:hypothetical protein
VDTGLQGAFDRLEATRLGLLARLSPHGDTVLNRLPEKGWSAAQVLFHVVTVEELALGYVRKKMQAGPALPRAGWRSRARSAALQVALASPLRAKAPPPVAEVPAFHDLQACRRRWETVRQGWQELLRELPPELLDRLLYRHPFVGRLGMRDTLRFLQAHLDHHARQIERILATGTGPGSPATRVAPRSAPSAGSA